MPRPRKAILDHQDGIIAMLRRGKTQQEAAEHFRVSRRHVIKVVMRQPGYVAKKDRPSFNRVSFFSPTRPQPSRVEDADLISAYLAKHGVTRCPTRALVATQAAIWSGAISSMLGANR